MPRLLFIFSFLFLFFSANAQYKYNRTMPREANGDTSEWWKWADQSSQRLGIERLLHTDDSLHYRFWTNEQIVEIWMKEDGSMRGKVVDFAKTFTPFDFKTMTQAPSTYYSDFNLLSDSLSRIAYQLFLSVQSIPSEDSIKDWFQGKDGVSYELECVDGNSYSLRHYWTPHVQDSTLAEVRAMVAFIDTMRETMQMNEKYSAFAATLKPGTYSTDGYMIMIIPTKKQKKKAQRYARKHPSSN